MSKYVALCGSRKGHGSDGPKVSAARQLMKLATALVESKGEVVSVWDAAEIDFPIFEGKSLEDYSALPAANLMKELNECNGLILSAPAYWGSLGGVIKNTLDLVGGAAYDIDPEIARKRLGNTLVFPIIVGAAPEDAGRGIEQLQYALKAMGARVSEARVLVDNPRTVDPEKLIRLVWEQAGDFVQELNAAIA